MMRKLIYNGYIIYIFILIYIFLVFIYFCLYVFIYSIIHLFIYLYIYLFIHIPRSNLPFQALIHSFFQSLDHIVTLLNAYKKPHTNFLITKNIIIISKEIIIIKIIFILLSYATHRPEKNLIQAASNGAMAALSVVASVAANLIAILGLIAFVDAILGYLGSLVGVPLLSFEVVWSVWCGVVVWYGWFALV